MRTVSFNGEAEENAMAEDREKISNGPNDRALNETIAGTGPGIPDDALGPGEELPDPPTDEQVTEVARKLGASTERDTLPLDGEYRRSDSVPIVDSKTQRARFLPL